ncbi:MAG: hypothetical protein GC147_13340 [Porphyrobacter sp.]|nr:hypothetical protein [Porphyrobacter sp.]
MTASTASSQPNVPTHAPARLKPARVEELLSALIFAAVLVVLVAGWFGRESGWVDPEHGLGYWLGIIGGSMMLLLLGYPVRKRVKPRSRTMGSVGFWFRFHMLLGVIGPTAVLYHSRFSFGSLNSTMAMSAMIIVASSGLVGRFLYSRVHRGYSGRKLELRSLKQEMDAMLAELEAAGNRDGLLLAALAEFERHAVEAGSTFGSSAMAVVGLGLRSRLTERRLRGQLRRTAVDTRELEAKLSHFFEAARRAAAFAFYQRSLHLWHLLHLPLVFLLAGSVVLHIVAVHMY